MVKFDENALICDFVEYYHIYDYRSLPLFLVATLAAGLRDDSRIKQHARGEYQSQNTLLLAVIADKLSNLIWGLSEDGARGINPPASIFNALTGRNNADNDDDDDVMVFDSVEDFEAARAKFMR